MTPKPLPNACYTIDPEADAAYIYLDGKPAKGERAHTVEVTKHIYLDFAADGRLLGIEILDSRNLPKAMKGDAT